jgi:Tfp pilus assembly protein PilO
MEGRAVNAPVLARGPAAAAATETRRAAPMRPRRSLQARLRRLGWPGIVGIGLLVMCAAFYLSTYEPAQARLRESRQSLAALRQELGAAQNPNGAERPAAEQLADFYRLFPSEKDLPDRLGRIFAAAQAQGLVLEQGEYKPALDKVGRLMHYDITLPVKGEYPQIRRFLAAVTKDVPTAALEQVQFERQKVGVATVDCKIRLTLYLERQT